MSAPILFAGIPILLVPLVYLLHRARPVDTGMTVLVTLVLALLALGLPFGQPVGALGGLTVQDTTTILGRSFTVEAADRLALAFMFSQAALLFLVSGIVETSAAFLPASLGVLGLLAAALFVRPFLFAAVFLEMGAALAVFMLVADEPSQALSHQATRGALRFLVYTTLGLPFILLTGWLLEANAASPSDPTFTNQAAVMLIVGFAVLLAVVPFHSWVPAIAEHAPPLAGAFVFSVFCQAVIFLLLTFLGTYPWLNQNPTVYRALTLAGGGMALFGAVCAFGQRNFGRSLGYAMLVDIGAVMLGIGLGTQAGVAAALTTLALRGIALPLWAVGIAQMRAAEGSDDFEALRGFGRRNPVAAGAVLLGLLSLAGFPLTAGFPGRWALLSLLAQIHPTAAVLLLLGTISVSFVCARGLSSLLASPEHSEAAPWSFPSISRASAAVYALGVTVVVVLGVFPQWLLPAVADTASALARLSR
jgi:formate hydrogenlyase subunit 3/multisubunit Na+/H+ antiporter MnhD subunit